MEENEVQSAPAVITMTIGITRKATGLTETYDLICTPVADSEPDPEQDQSPKEN
jgi:hypothetical protein